MIGVLYKENRNSLNQSLSATLRPPNSKNRSVTCVRIRLERGERQDTYASISQIVAHLEAEPHPRREALENQVDKGADGRSRHSCRESNQSEFEVYLQNDCHTMTVSVIQ